MQRTQSSQAKFPKTRTKLEETYTNYTISTPLPALITKNVSIHCQMSLENKITPIESR